ncbi:MAG: Arc family DNA-binding protein [Rubrivivax sp.]|nr:Arc family DNA-binding protein [Rubrivivax sp.]
MANQRAKPALREWRPVDIIGITLLWRSLAMADIVLRNLEDGLKEKLRQRAASNQRSMNAELREIVSAALAQPRRSSRADLKKLAADIRALSAGRRQTPSEDLLRESRDQR